MSHAIRTHALPAAALAIALVLGACGDTAAPTTTAASPAATTTVASQAAPSPSMEEAAALDEVGVLEDPAPATTATSPPETTTTTVAALTEPRLPADFPLAFPIPPESVTRSFNGSAQLGFVVSVTTAFDPPETMAYLSDVVTAFGEWSFSPSQGISTLESVEGYEGEWFAARGDHYWAEFTGPFVGSFEILGNIVHIRLTPHDQPPDDRLPDLLPGPDVLPRPDTPLSSVGFGEGRITAVFEYRDGNFESVVDAYRQRGWREVSFTVGDPNDPLALSEAIGELAGWRITLLDFGNAPTVMFFEDMNLIYRAR